MQEGDISMKRRIAALSVAIIMAFSLTACGNSTKDSSTTSEDKDTHSLVLSDDKITLDGQDIPDDGGTTVTVSHDIVYYKENMGSDYGAGSDSDAHSQEEADANVVVTIREAGTYQVSGSLSAGQLAIDLGDDAKRDPNAVVTLILDNVNITCTVAPAVIFYNVYECDTNWVAYDEGETDDYQDTATVDTSAAGANVILADDSVNNINGSYVAKIYKEGTTKKLHKYDGAFYSRMSMNIDGQEAGTGVLNITASNEGLDTELHLTINGGSINIQSQDDGINTNEDGVSVTTINGGTIQINAGLGAEGDGIDSNGYLVINGGKLYTMASDHSPDGGLDADSDILINGGYVIAQGVRNDAVSSSSTQQYMELFFGSTLPAGSTIELTDPDGTSLFSFTTEKACQSLVFSSPDLAVDVSYTLKVNGITQQYTSNSSGGFGGMGGMGGGNFTPPDLPNGQTPPTDSSAAQNGQPPQKPDDTNANTSGQKPQRPDNANTSTDSQKTQRPDDAGSKRPTDKTTSGTGSTEFILSSTVHTFSGISDSAQDSGKTDVTFSATITVAKDGTSSVSDIKASKDVPSDHIQLTVTDVPSEGYSATCKLSDGTKALEDIMPDEPGDYQLTISVVGDDTYTGTSQFSFTIPSE